MFFSYLNSPIGILEIASDDTGLKSVSLFDGGQSGECGNNITCEAKKQLSEYFSGTRREFSLPLSPDGTPFEKAVWDELLQIPFGETRSYREIAAVVGKPGASRAVGNAVGKNPLLVLIPCHRVITSDGRLGGFSAGLENKIFLHGIENIRVKPEKRKNILSIDA